MSQRPNTNHPVRSERTIFPRSHTRPLVGEHFERAKAAEAARAERDPHYITAEQAQALPPEERAQPDVQSRVQYSQGDWPETRSTATRALGELKPGAGETVQRRSVDADALFQGRQVGEE